MADTTVGIRLSLSGQRQAVSGINNVNSALGNTAGALQTVAGSAAGAAAGIAKMAGGKVIGAVRGLASTVAGVGAAALATTTAMATSLIRTGVGYNDLEQRAGAAFTTILGSAEAAQKMMADIREFGRSSPFPRQAFISATQQLLGFGYSAEEIIPLLKTINDSTAAIGGNADTIATITDVFATIKSNARVGTEDLNRLAEQGINGFSAIAEATGQSVEEARKAIKGGEIDGAQGIKILTDYMTKRFAGASENVKKTWSGATDRVKGAWRDLGSSLAEPFVSKTGGGYAIVWANLLADKLRKAANAAPLLMDLLRSGKTDAKALEGILGPRAGSALTTTMLNLRGAVQQIMRAFGLVKVNVDGTGTGLDLMVKVSATILALATSLTTKWILFLRGFTDPAGVNTGDNPFIQWGATFRNTLDQIRDAWALFTLGFTNAGYATDASAPWIQFGAAVAGAFDYVRGAWELFKLGFSNPGDVTSQSTLWVQFGAAISGAIDGFRTFDWSNIIGSLSSMGGSVKDLMPAWTAFRESMPSMAVVGGLLGDALTVVAAVLRILADHVDLLVKYAPLLAALYVAWRIGMVIVAASVAVTNARMIIGTAVTLANIAAMKQHTNALLASVAAQRQMTVEQLRAELAGKKTLAMRIRERIATVASTIATKAWAVATKVAAVAARIMGGALRFMLGPIGIAITVIALLVGAIVLLYQRNEKFRMFVQVAWMMIKAIVMAVVTWFLGTALPAIVGFLVGLQEKFNVAKAVVAAVFDGIKAAAAMAFNWVKDNWPLILAFLTGPIGLAVYWIVKHWDAIKAGAQALWDLIKAFGGGLKDFAENAIRKVVGGAIQFGQDKFDAFKRGIEKVRDVVRDLIGFFKDLADKITNLPGIKGIVDTAKSIIPGLAEGGTLYKGQPTLVGERGPELILPQANGEVIPNHKLNQLSRTDAADLEALHGAGTSTQVIQLVVDRKVLAQATVGGLNATNARR